MTPPPLPRFRSPASLPLAMVMAFGLTLWGMPVSSSHAQLARKPSYYEKDAGAPSQNLVARPEGGSDPAGTMRGNQGTKGAPPELASMADRQEFDGLARVYNAGTPLAQPHVIFVIDRGNHRGNKASPRISYVNTPRFQLHDRFLRETGRFKGSRDEFNRNYAAPERRFILGTLSWQPQIQRFVFEFWEGDVLTPVLLQTARSMIAGSFFADAQFKANSTAQEQVAREAGIAVVTQAELIGQQRFLPLNVSRNTGRLRIIASLDAMRDLQPSDIVVLREVPISLPPVAGVITERPSTMLSHVNLLARGWGIPNAYVQDAGRQLKALDGQWVHLQVDTRDYTLRPATEAEREAARQRAKAQPRGRVQLIVPDLRSTKLQPLATLRAGHRTQCGAKAANLGEVRSARIAGTVVPDGFCIPFGAYAEAMGRFRLAERVARMQALPRFDTDADVRRAALARLREDIERMPMPGAVSEPWGSRWFQQLGGQGVFVRSSSSSEDLPNFSGAGLYTTVPNVKDAGALTDAVRKVWASVFNFEAWEARSTAGIAHDAVAMAVFVQKAVNSQASGVMITRNPLDPDAAHTTFIAAKRGLGIRVVDGHRVAEQVLYSSWSKAIQVLSQSGEDTELQLDPNGGVREVPLAGTGRRVLGDERVKRLAQVGKDIERRFGGKAQDIEWAVTDEQQIIILQARPYANPPAGGR